MDYHTLDLNMGQEKKKKAFYSHQEGSVKEADTVQPNSVIFYIIRREQ